MQLAGAMPRVGTGVGLRNQSGGRAEMDPSNAILLAVIASALRGISRSDHVKIQAPDHM